MRGAIVQHMLLRGKRASTAAVAHAGAHHFGKRGWRYT
jgi:hypothetical protein